MTTYPDYISKFNSEMFMILDPSSENIIDSNYLNGDLYHFYTFNEEIEIELGTSKHIRKIGEYCAYVLVILAIILASVAHAFFLLLHPRDFSDSLTTQDPSDPNNPWTISKTFHQTDENGKALKQTLVQTPDENTNLFYSYPTSLLAMFLFLTGNFLRNNDRALYLAQKAEVIANIELFYLFPRQRRLRTWFPEVIRYHVDVEMARRYIKEAIKKGNWNMDDWPEMKRKILKLLSIEDAIKRD
ncbi:973_t:CDS:2 [Funneliformis caledonium]|uniref:973_t:CDS:1 n=1 Tax=Funneliformis caledonium TaxID=1117310 RepID=A0A9N9AS67_9GLOM|nr:973_t:CDS:2 [Funneliformis caledonium]